MHCKKIPLVLSILLAPLASFADSSVAVYGMVDLFGQYGHGGGGNQFALQSGGLNGSRLGFKGAEDLGQGLKTVFQLEMGINADTGTQGQGGLAFGRQAYAGLASSTAGTLTLGRQHTPTYLLVDNFDALGTAAGSPFASGVASVNLRKNNAVVYATPTWGGFSASAMLALGEKGATSQGNHYALSAQYVGGAFSVGVSGSQTRRDSADQRDETFAVMVAAYDFGVVRLSGGMQAIQNFGGLDAVDRTEAFLGANIPLSSRDTLSAGVASSRTRHLEGSRASQWSLVYSHDLSQRTRVYAVVSSIQNGSLTGYSTDGATGAGPHTGLGQDVTALQLGVRHSF
ncbi:porin [Roseateles koreensis]|uniref:Porin n=1 Tax=Roseateles koreensis TaxID=2987526 RepID=A0ABT5KWF1_9BURK|nr:porin [Roseateles koreensis]MDC8786745.1 porin [Roseateles koreensis]